MLILSLSVFAGAAAAAEDTDDVYTVSDVAVDSTASTAAEAREQALADGHRLAFDRLLARLVPDAQRANLPALDSRRISLMVLSFGIDEEKTSNVRYLARLTFGFRRSEVREFVRAHGVAIAETRSRPVLILPVYEDAGAVSLWDEPNPWFAAWENLPLSDGLVQLRIPAGDLADIRDISAEQAARAEPRPLEAISERYGVSGAIIANAVLSPGGGSARQSLEVSTTFVGAALGDRTAVRSFSFGDGETLEAVAARAARAISRQIEEDWKRENLLRFDNPNELIAIVPLSELGDWVDIRARLREVAFLRQSRLLSASRERVVVRLDYYGDAGQLQVALAQRNLVLEPGAVYWLLREASERGERAVSAPTEPGVPTAGDSLPLPGSGGAR